MSNIILLDRNVISLIKDINSGKAITDSNKLCMADRLRKLDSSENKISPIFSIIEGQKGRPENLQEKEETAEIETAELRKFFKNAHVDKYPTDNVGDLYAALNIDSSYVNTEKAMKSFLRKASDILKNPVSQSTRDSVADSIFLLAKECKISSHEGGIFALLLALLCLYRDNNALKVIKFKKEKKIKLYNALNDIFHFINFIRIKAYLANLNSSKHLEFVTMDKALDGLFSYIRDVNVEDTNNQQIIAYKLFFSEAITNILPDRILKELQLFRA